jgi:hypothetical protein
MSCSLDQKLACSPAYNILQNDVVYPLDIYIYTACPYTVYIKHMLLLPLFVFINSAVDHLSLHVMVRELDTPDKQELKKLQMLKAEQGELIAADEKKFRRLRAQTEREILQVTLLLFD